MYKFQYTTNLDFNLSKIKSESNITFSYSRHGAHHIQMINQLMVIHKQSLLLVAIVDDRLLQILDYHNKLLQLHL